MIRISGIYQHGHCLLSGVIFVVRNTQHASLPFRAGEEDGYERQEFSEWNGKPEPRIADDAGEKDEGGDKENYSAEESEDN